MSSLEWGMAIEQVCADSLDMRVETGTVGPIPSPRRSPLARLGRRKPAPDPSPQAVTAPVERPPRLILRFAVYSGLAFAVAAGVGVWIARDNATRRAEHEVWADARFTADQLGRDDLAKTAMRAPVRSPATVAQLDELFGRKALNRGVLRVTLFSRDGRVTYSTDHSLIGSIPYDISLVRKAMSGKTVHDVAQLRGGIGDNPKALKSYVPVYWFFDKDSRPNGVIGVYRDYAPVAAAIRDDMVSRTATIFLALLVLYIPTFPILRGITRTLEARNRQLAEQAEALRISEEQYRLIVETAAEGVCLLDAEGRIVFANQKLAEMVGRTTETIAGAVLVELMDEASRATMDPRWFRSRHAANEQREVTLRRGLGLDVYTQMSANPIFDRDGGYTGALVMAMDVTDRKRAEEALHEMEERLRHAPAAKSSRQAADIAHDFNNAVRAITGYSEYLLSNLDENDPLYREASQIKDAAAGAVGLTRQLLALSRRESFRAGLVDLGELAERLSREKLAAILNENVEIVVGSEPGTSRVAADAAQLEQVLVNLAIYARDAMPEGGRFTIATRNVDCDEQFASEHFPLRAGPYVLLEVSDTGHALDEATRERLFRPFGGEERLSLATVYGIVKQSDGYIWVDSEPGRGSTFSIYLPRPEQAA
jgi:PAS domain S-box-containing protein